MQRFWRWSTASTRQQAGSDETLLPGLQRALVSVPGERLAAGDLQADVAEAPRAEGAALPAVDSSAGATHADASVSSEPEAEDFERSLFAAFNESAAVETSSNRLASTVESVDAARLATELRTLLRLVRSRE